MKKLILLSAVFLTVTIASCSKDDDIETPEWVNEWIVEIENMEHCFKCEIHRYEYKGQYYYELFSLIFSCQPCQVHHANGDDVDWEEMDQIDYVAKRKSKKVIYKKEAD